MIARHEQPDVWLRIAAPLPSSSISWRQDGKPMQRDGRYLARFVAYTDAHVVRERLDSIVPGEWDATLELLPSRVLADMPQTWAFKCRLQVLGVIREDVGEGDDYKSAATDAFKRAAVRFGIASELYDYEQNWVQVDSDSKYAKPVEDPGEAYARRYKRTEKLAAAPSAASPARRTVETTAPPDIDQRAPLENAPATDEVSCPKCGGKMWDNRIGKKNPKAPDFKCRTRTCDGVVWPPRATDAPVPASVVRDDELPPPLEDEQDDLPF